ncbi:hypothetical protein JCM8208_005042 [Rhodotorula glutinis]
MALFSFSVLKCVRRRKCRGRCRDRETPDDEHADPTTAQTLERKPTADPAPPDFCRGRHQPFPSPPSSFPRPPSLPPVAPRSRDRNTYSRRSASPPYGNAFGSVVCSLVDTDLPPPSSPHSSPTLTCRSTAGQTSTNADSLHEAVPKAWAASGAVNMHDPDVDGARAPKSAWSLDSLDSALAWSGTVSDVGDGDDEDGADGGEGDLSDESSFCCGDAAGLERGWDWRQEWTCSKAHS